MATSAAPSGRAARYSRIARVFSTAPLMAPPALFERHSDSEDRAAFAASRSESARWRRGFLLRLDWRPSFQILNACAPFAWRDAGLWQSSCFFQTRFAMSLLGSAALAMWWDVTDDVR